MGWKKGMEGDSAGRDMGRKKRIGESKGEVSEGIYLGDTVGRKGM